MASLEELMAGIFGNTEARGAQGLNAPADDPRRRRGRGPAGGGYEGLEGQAGLASLLPHILGLPFYGYSGPGAAAKGAGVDQLPFRPEGPSGRNLEQAGVDFEPALPPGLVGRDAIPPGVDNRLALGGANVAPGNIDTGRAFMQPPGLGLDAIPRTQGWRNLAPGFSAAAQLGYGTPGFAKGLAGIAGIDPSEIGVRPGGGGGIAGGGGAPGAGGAIGTTGGGAAVKGGPAPAAAGGGGGGGVSKGGGGGPKQPSQPKQSQIGAKKAPATKTGGPGLKTGGDTTIVAKKGGSKGAKAGKQGGVQKVVGGALNQVGNIVGDVFSAAGQNATQPAPKPSAGAAKQTTFTPKPAPGKTKPKGGTSLTGGVFK